MSFDTLATGCGDNSIRIFEVDDAQAAGELQDASAAQKVSSFQLVVNKSNAHPSDVNCVRWSPTDLSLLASAGDDNAIRLWRYTPDSDGQVTDMQ